MRPKSLLLAAAFTVGLTLPAMAQQPTLHRFVTLFKFNDQALKSLIDNPQDRSAAVSKIAEQFGGKLEVLYVFPFSNEFDGMVIIQAANDAAMEKINLVVRSSGSFSRLQVTEVLTPAEFKTALESAKEGAASYAPPGR